jgi:hypothetical protein
VPLKRHSNTNARGIVVTWSRETIPIKSVGRESR